MLIIFYTGDRPIPHVPEIPGVQFEFRNTESDFDRVASEKHFLPSTEYENWQKHSDAWRYFLTTNHNQLMIVDCLRIYKIKKLLRVIQQLQKNQLTTFDLLQLSYASKCLRLTKPVYDSLTRTGDIGLYVGRNLASVDMVFRNWIRITRFTYRNIPKTLEQASKFLHIRSLMKIVNWLNGLGVVVIARGEYSLRKAAGLQVPLVYHSFERGLDCYLISRKFASALPTINNPILLETNTLLSACARTQNLVSARVARNFLQ